MRRLHRYEKSFGYLSSGCKGFIDEEKSVVGWPEGMHGNGVDLVRNLHKVESGKDLKRMHA